MSSVQIKDVLLDPLGQVAPNVPIIVTTTVGYGQTLTSSESNYVTNTAGAYDFQLVYGTHSIDVRFGSAFVNLGIVNVSDALTGPLTINELLDATEPPIPAYVVLITRLTAEAQAAALASENSAIKSESEADRAESEADRAK